MAGFGQMTPDLASGPAPAHYVAGAGRGAIGFTTRSDIGPAQENPTLPGADRSMAAAAAGGVAPAGYVAGAGRGATGMGDSGSVALMGAVPGGLGAMPMMGRGRGAPADRGDYSEGNFDEFTGFQQRLFDDGEYDAEDAEADKIYQAVDKHIDSRRKRQREERLRQELIKMRVERPRITDQFADLKAGLSDVSETEWANIPEIGDYTIKRKNRKLEASALPVPDAVLDAASKATLNGTVVGTDTPAAASGGGVTDLKGFSKARTDVLSLRLDRMSDSVSGQTVVDPKGFLTDLNSTTSLSDAEIGDIKKARLLVTSMYKTNPKHGPAWIAGARVEEQVHKLAQARKIIRQGCEACPDDEDVWLEAARLATPEQVNTILANAVRNIPKSVKVWMAAAELEKDVEGKRAVLRRALEYVPNSVRLWKSAVELEEPEEARVMLSRAVECVPQSVDLWLALARLETYKRAQAVLNKARKKIPTDPSIWITAAKLEEAQGNAANVEKVINRAVKSLSAQHVIIDREQWIKLAEDAEKAEAPATCAAVLNATIGIGVESLDRKRTWLGDAEALLRRGSVAAARTVYAHTLREFPTKKSIWLKAASLEKQHGTPDDLDKILKAAVTNCPAAEILWLMAAKEKWLLGNVPESRRILEEANRHNPGNEQILLAAAKLEWENAETDRARVLLQRAREATPSARVYMKAALLERECGNRDAEGAILAEGLTRFKTAPKLWMMAGQLAEAQDDNGRALALYQRGVQACPGSVPLWKLAAKLVERTGGHVKVRSLLEMARLKNPKNEELFLESVRLEKRAGNEKLAASLLAKGLQECPTSGLLYAEEIQGAPRAVQRRKSLDALKRTDNHPLVVVEVARFFARCNKYEMAREWLHRAVSLDPDNGDIWALFLQFEHAHGTPDHMEKVIAKAEEVKPRHGALWCAVSKQTVNRRKSVRDLLPLVVATLPPLVGGA